MVTFRPTSRSRVGDLIVGSVSDTKIFGEGLVSIQTERSDRGGGARGGPSKSLRTESLRPDDIFMFFCEVLGSESIEL